MSKNDKTAAAQDELLPVSGANDTPGEQEGSYLTADSENVKDAVDELNNIGPESGA